MMNWALLLFLFATTLAARASDPIPVPARDASATVTQPHVTAELIPETSAIWPGQPFAVALHLHADPDWHTYWANPGDAGLATTIEWKLPPGFAAGPIQWPPPEKHDMGGLMTYGYAGDVYLLTTITPPKTGMPAKFTVTAKAQWLVCREECIPGHADLTLHLRAAGNANAAPKNKDLFDQARARLPASNTRWNVTANYGPRMDVESRPAPMGLNLYLHEKTPGAADHIQVRFYPEQANVLGNLDKDQSPTQAFLPDGAGISLAVTLQQNGETPDHLSGVIVSDQPLIGDAKAVSLSEFPVSVQTAVVMPSPAPAASNAPSPPAPASGQPLLIAVLGAALLGGLVLNLMPCVLPVLSLKVFSLIRHAGDNRHAAWKQGLAFTAGVVVSFWILAGMLIALRTAGNHLGWGFQMQSPGFILALIFLFFLLSLNLFGVFELGASLVGLDAKATNRFGGLLSSFGNGALATLAATPCTAPFMGSSLGFAAQQPPSVALLIFTFLALGMAAPYLLLTTFPGALRYVPKPGPWMESLKQFMGFLLLATVIFLVYVFGALVGPDQVPWLMAALLLAGLGAWIYGRWSGPAHSPATRLLTFILALAAIGYAIVQGVALTKMSPPPASVAANTPAAPGQENWQPWTPDAVSQALAQNRPVFVDFTAAWCLSCKVNEHVALDVDSVRQAFAQKNVALFRADWTHSDPAISSTLEHYHRDGVPLYLLYSPTQKDTPQVLPEVLTPGIVTDALNNL